MILALLVAQFWAAPPSLTLRGTASSEHDRPYSTPARTRDIAGQIAISCEYTEGAPCGDGVNGALDVDARAGYGEALTALVRLRGATEGGVYVDRAALRLKVGPFALDAGRDVLTLGPAVRSSLILSSNAPPLDGVRARLLPVDVAPGVRLSLLYFYDRLRDPQRFHRSILDGTRLELELLRRVTIAGTRLLELGGRDAPDYGGAWGFVLEHFGRTREREPETAENNRLSFALDVALPELWNGRAYYQIAFEDTRKAFSNSLHYDADHLFGVELRAIDLGPWKGLAFEAVRTGWVSQEHGVFTTGMTNAGRAIGSALGPDGESFWLRADLHAGAATVSPWAEWLRFLSDRYGSDQPTGVFVTAKGPTEHRQRLGADVRMPFGAHWSVSGGAFFERIANADFIPGSTFLGGGARASVTWTP